MQEKSDEHRNSPAVDTKEHVLYRRRIADLEADSFERRKAFQILDSELQAYRIKIVAADLEIAKLLNRTQAAEAAIRSRDAEHKRRWWNFLPLGVQLLFFRLAKRVSATPRWLRLAEDIRATGLFDEAYYRIHNPYVVTIGMDPALHFAVVGWKMDRRPNSFFSPRYYTHQLSGTTAGRENPLIHYARIGWKQGVRPSLEFDPNLYLANKADLVDADTDPLLHYIQHGDSPGSDGSFAYRPALNGPPRSIMAATSERNSAWAPLPTFPDEKGECSVTVLLDDVRRDVITDRVCTAIIVGLLMAKRTGARLKIATRGQALDPSMFNETLGRYGLERTGAIEFAHIPSLSQRSLATTRGDRFLTASWQPLRDVRRACAPILPQRRTCAASRSSSRKPASRCRR